MGSFLAWPIQSQGSTPRRSQTLTSHDFEPVQLWQEAKTGRTLKKTGTPGALSGLQTLQTHFFVVSEVLLQVVGFSKKKPRNDQAEFNLKVVRRWLWVFCRKPLETSLEPWKTGYQLGCRSDIPNQTTGVLVWSSEVLCCCLFLKSGRSEGRELTEGVCSFRSFRRLVFFNDLFVGQALCLSET